MTRQDLAVLIFYFLGYSRYGSFLYKHRKTPVARFLAFHDILPEKVKQFDENMYLLKSRTNVISLDQFFKGNLSNKKINTVITFDDGYKSWVTQAVPVLKKYELPAAFFICSGYLGLDKGEQAEFNRSNLFKTLGPRKTSPCLERSDVKKLADEGYTIGGHTINHINLAGEKAREIIRHEICDDKTMLESIVGYKLKYFSYPFGEAENSEIDISRILRESGYKAAFTANGGFNHSFTDPYLLHRDLVKADMNSILFLARVFGNVDAVYYTKRLLRRVFFRADSGLYKNL